MKKIQVAVIAGSDSDLPIVFETVKIFEKFDISYTVAIASAHRTPEKVKEYVKKSEANGAEVFIAVAGMSAALPGVVAAETLCPVIGVPIKGVSLTGMDSLFSIAQMPPGIPVAASAIGTPGAINAGILAMEILGIKYDEIRKKIAQYRTQMSDKIIEKDNELQEKGIKNYLENQKV